MPACSDPGQPMTASVSARTGWPGVTGMTSGWPCALIAIDPPPVKTQLNGLRAVIRVAAWMPSGSRGGGNAAPSFHMNGC
jgi:hypothetical protein